MKRYELCLDNSGMEEDPAGDYYLVEDVEKLLEEILLRRSTFESMIAYPED